MKVKSAELTCTAYTVKQIPKNDPKPKVIVLGKSNVGKSRFINTLTHTHRLAHTSSSPGKTQSINYYLINKSFYLVDVPGYGFAKATATDRAQWDTLVQHLIKQTKPIALAILLFDSRRGIDSFDEGLVDYVHHLNVCSVLTKCDKLTNQEMIRAVAAQTESLSALMDDDVTVPVIPFSSVSLVGKTEILIAIHRALIAAGG